MLDLLLIVPGFFIGFLASEVLGSLAAPDDATEKLADRIKVTSALIAITAIVALGYQSRPSDKTVQLVAESCTKQNLVVQVRGGNVSCVPAPGAK